MKLETHSIYASKNYQYSSGCCMPSLCKLKLKNIKFKVRISTRRITSIANRCFLKKNLLTNNWLYIWPTIPQAEN